MNKDQDFELLSQYVDGELDSQAELALKQRLLAEPEFNQQLRKLKSLNGNIQSVMPDYANEPMSDDLTALLAIDDEDTEKQRPQNASAWYKQYLPLAASVLFVMLLGNFMLNQSDDLQQVLPAGYNLSALKSNVTENMVSGGELIIVQSFLDDQEQICREYFARQQQMTEHGISCFEAGNWQKKAFSVEVSTGQDYVTANGEQDDVEAFLQTANFVKLSPQQELAYLQAAQ